MMTARERAIFRVKSRSPKRRHRLQLDTAIFLVLLVLATGTGTPVFVRLHEVFGATGTLKNDYYCSLIKDGSSTVDMPRTELVKLCAEWGVDLAF